MWGKSSICWNSLWRPCWRQAPAFCSQMRWLHSGPPIADRKAKTSVENIAGRKQPKLMLLMCWGNSTKAVLIIIGSGAKSSTAKVIAKVLPQTLSGIAQSWPVSSKPTIICMSWDCALLSNWELVKRVVCAAFETMENVFPYWFGERLWRVRSSDKTVLMLTTKRTYYILVIWWSSIMQAGVC